MAGGTLSPNGQKQVPVMPRAMLSGWLQVAAAFNPTTYVLETMRGVLITGWDLGQLASGFAIIGALSLIVTACGGGASSGAAGASRSN